MGGIALQAGTPASANLQGQLCALMKQQTDLQQQLRHLAATRGASGGGEEGEVGESGVEDRHAVAAERLVGEQGYSRGRDGGQMGEGGLGASVGEAGSLRVNRGRGGEQETL